MLPCLGVGIGYRAPLRRDILRNLSEIDFLEAVSDTFFRHEEALRALAGLKPVIPHSLRLSVGSEIDPAYLDNVARTVRACRPPWWSDHLAFTHAGGVRVGHMAPVPHTEEALSTVERNVRVAQGAISAPFALENITMPFYWPDSTMAEHEFLTALVKRTGCYLLLDLENVRINAANHARGARDFLDRLPLERVAQVHVAGGSHSDDLEEDTHSEPVSEATWELLEYLCELRPAPSVLIERDQAYPPFPELLAEVRRARTIVGRSS